MRRRSSRSWSPDCRRGGHQRLRQVGLIERSIDTLRVTLIEEMVVVGLLCILFPFMPERAWRFVVPSGVLISFLVMHYLGINANIMSLGGIAIAIGVMVDSSVVMVENAHKHPTGGGRVHSGFRKDEKRCDPRAAKRWGRASSSASSSSRSASSPSSRWERRAAGSSSRSPTRRLRYRRRSILAVTVVPVLMFTSSRQGSSPNAGAGADLSSPLPQCSYPAAALAMAAGASLSLPLPVVDRGRGWALFMGCCSSHRDHP